MDNERTLTQATKVYMYMQAHGSITQREANKFGCMRLAARIKDLEKRGAVIAREMIQVTNQDDTTSRVARYSIAEVKDAEGTV